MTAAAAHGSQSRPAPQPGHVGSVRCIGALCTEAATEQFALRGRRHGEETYLWLCPTHLERFLADGAGAGSWGRWLAKASGVHGRLRTRWGRSRSLDAVPGNTPRGDADGSTGPR